MSKGQSTSDFRRVVELMKEMGSKEGFEGTPPGQHRWHKWDSGTTPLQRMWGEMIRGTCSYGRRTAYYSIDHTGTEGHMEHLAKALEMDIANAYRTWRQGATLGLWRNGTDEEGDRRLYLRGDVPKTRSDKTLRLGEGKAVQGITRPHIWKYVKDWPEEKQQKLAEQLRNEDALERAAHAELTNANRAVFMEREDSVLQEWGIPPARQEHKKKGESEEERLDRLARLKALTPLVSKCVQTLANVVQSSQKNTVQPLQPNCVQSNYQRSISRSVGTLPANGHKTPQDEKKRTPFKQLPALPQLPPLSESEKQALEVVFAEVQNLQTRFKHMDFSQEVVSRKCKNDQLFAYRVVAEVGCEYVPQAMKYVERELEKLNRNSLGKLPGERPGARSLGLILKLVKDYAEKMDESARIENDERQRWFTWAMETCRKILVAKDETAEAKYGARKFMESPELLDKGYQDFKRLADQVEARTGVRPEPE